MEEYAKEIRAYAEDRLKKIREDIAQNFVAQQYQKTKDSAKAKTEVEAADKNIIDLKEREVWMVEFIKSLE